jgi:DNA transformation protein and related proteins
VDPEAIRDLFASLGPVRIRRMFGGQGIYSGELMFALEIADELFLKVDDGTMPAFRTAGSRPFVYERDGRATEMSYWRLPDGALDDPDEAERWGRLALEAARRAAIRKPQRVKRRREARP